MSIRTLPNAGNALALLLGIASRVLSSHSTVAMIVHPIALTCQDPSTVDAGAFLDGTICDAAKVVGAGISASDEAGEFATPVRLRESLDRTRRPRSRKRRGRVFFWISLLTGFRHWSSLCQSLATRWTRALIARHVLSVKHLTAAPCCQHVARRASGPAGRLSRSAISTWVSTEGQM